MCCVNAHTEEVIKCVPTVKKQGEPCGLCKIQLLLKVPVRQQHTQHTTRKTSSLSPSSYTLHMHTDKTCYLTDLSIFYVSLTGALAAGYMPTTLGAQ